jgi:hypothetical protein
MGQAETTLGFNERGVGDIIIFLSLTGIRISHFFLTDIE